ncbi:AN1-type zinc finger protein 2B-like [Ornithodoros turicata]|uniref:AN1-type zinc finger protein 2B-like n=1 Tax=Ornithodoros turicata TaxID=34597 RepID=UPI003138C031
MEFPDLGKHCSEVSCNRLDFLPIKCDGCKKIYCKEHFKYAQHGCSGSVDMQVPVCPLCNCPVPGRRGDPPDRAVSDHLDRDCRADNSKKKGNRCAVKGCKQKELIPLTCDRCRRNHCLRHRHPDDHNCSPATRVPTCPPQKTRTCTMEEDEALALALQQSLYEMDHPQHRTRQATTRTVQNNRHQDKNCTVS